MFSYKNILTALVCLFLSPLFIATYGENQPATQTADNSAGSSPRRSSAWTLSYPLGLRMPSSIDTLMLNYQRTAIPAMVSDAWAATGNLGAEGQNQIFFDRPARSQFIFKDALLPWIPTFDKQKFYNVYIPMTIASYGFGGNRDSGQERLAATFAGNVNRRIGIGAFIDYLYSKGSYANQADKELSYGFSGYYLGDRYQMQAMFQQYNLLNKENGGITDDLYITDPAVLQGGVDKIEAKSIPVNLSNAHTRLKGKEFYMNHVYNVGFWREEQVNDTLSREVYVPVTKFIYTLDYQGGGHNFRSTGTTNDFWAHSYHDASSTYDQTDWWQLSNTLGIQMIEGFQKWAKFGLAAYASFENRRFTLPNHSWITAEPSETDPATLTPLPEGIGLISKGKQDVLWIGGQLTKQRGSLLTYDINARFGVVGDAAGDIDVEGHVQSRFKLFGDTVQIAARGHFRNEEQPWLLQHYVSNHFAWDNSFGKTRSFRIAGQLDIPWTRTSIEAGVENLQNYVYFGTDGLPHQNGGSIQVFMARLKQRLRFGIWNWDNTLIFQTTSNKEVLPLPALTIYSNMYLHFKAFKALKLQIGVDCNYYTKYRGVNYQPATMAFTVGDDWQIGNFPFCNAYITAHLYKTRFYVLYSHFNQGWFSKQYFSMPHYPVNPRRLVFGISVDFAN